MMEEQELKTIQELLIKWVLRIRFDNAISLFDINKLSEGLSLKLLNIVYDLELKDLNDQQVNYPGLDLGDDSKSKIAFQVSSRTDTDKVISTLRMAIEKKYNQ